MRTSVKIEGILLDFYGTVVHEDDDLVDQVCRNIARSATARCSAEDVGTYWWERFQCRFANSYGASFETQRTIERTSIQETLDHFDASGNADEFAALLFEQWQSPIVHDDAAQFLDQVRVPVVVISNIDRADIEAAIGHADLRINKVLTSEDVRSYKPRAELFQAGLDALDLDPTQVLHVGDSIQSDVAGADALGTATAWVNRTNKPCPPGIEPTIEVASLNELLDWLEA